MSTIHYHLIRDAAGLPVRLEWNPEYQERMRVAALEQMTRDRAARTAARLPMAAYRDWAKQHGLIPKDAEYKAG